MIGGGPAGIAAAVELSTHGEKVLLLEQSDRLGGTAARLCCKATTLCTYCGVCHVERKLTELQALPSITVRLQCQVADLSDHGSHFEVTIKDSQAEQQTLRIQRIVWAGGFTPHDPSAQAQFGYGRYPNVVTGLEVEETLRDEDFVLRKSDAKRPHTIAFIQCVGSREVRSGGAYCSQICCAYSVRLANLLLHRDPTLRVTMFYMDIQSPSRQFDQLLDDLKPSLRLINALPAEVLPGPEHHLLIRYEAGPGKPPQEELFDMVVLAIGLRPAPVPPVVLEALKLEVSCHGFLIAPLHSARVAVVGTAVAPLPIIRAMAHARSAITELLNATEDSPCE